MACDKCRRPAIVYQRYSGLHLCEPHFNEDFEKKAKRAIRKHRWIRSGDRIGVAMNGGTDGGALAFFLSHLLGKRHDIDLIGLSVDDRPGPYHGTTQAKDIARTLGIPSVSASLREGFGVRIDDMATKEGARLPCSLCDVPRNLYLELIARDHGVTKIALGIDLDDAAGEILMHTLRGDPSRLFQTPAAAECQVPRIRPFMYIPKREVSLYAFLHLNGFELGKCPYSHNAVLEDIQTHLNEYTYRHPATKYALVNLGDELQSSRVMQVEASNIFAKCGEPVSGRCKRCDLLNKVRYGS